MINYARLSQSCELFVNWLDTVKKKPTPDKDYEDFLKVVKTLIRFKFFNLNKNTEISRVSKDFLGT